MRSIRQAKNRAIATLWQDAAAIIRAPCILITGGAAYKNLHMDTYKNLHLDTYKNLHNFTKGIGHL